MIRLYLKKNIFDHFWSFFGPFWVILGPKMTNFIFCYKSCYRLAISFPTIYDATLFGEKPFLTIFGIDIIMRLINYA